MPKNVKPPEQFIKPDQSGKGNKLYNIINHEKRDLPPRKIPLLSPFLKNLFASNALIPDQGSRKVLLSPVIPFRVGDFTIANEIPSVKTLGPCLEHRERERGYTHTHI